MATVSSLRRPLRQTKSGSLERAEEHESIKQCIREILNTRPGERLHNPLFGSNCKRLVFALNDDVTKQEFIHETIEAVARWEKRCAVKSVNVEQGPKAITVSVVFVVLRLKPQVTDSVQITFQTA